MSDYCNCDITWEPVQVEYRPSGRAEVYQIGECSVCHQKYQLDYEEGEPNPIGGSS